MQTIIVFSSLLSRPARIAVDYRAATLRALATIERMRALSDAADETLRALDRAHGVAK